MCSHIVITSILISDLSTDAVVSLQTMTSVTEGSMLNVSVELATSGTLACELVVTLVVTPGTATGKKLSIHWCQKIALWTTKPIFINSFSTVEDYALQMNDSNIITVTYGVGSGDGTVETAMISAVEDTAVEGDHEFTVSIQSTSPQAMLGVSSSVTATIMDDDRKCDLKCDNEL